MVLHVSIAEKDMLFYKGSELLETGLHSIYLSYLLSVENPDSEKFINGINNIVKDRIRYHEQGSYFDSNGLSLGEESRELMLDMLGKNEASH